MYFHLFDGDLFGVVFVDGTVDGSVGALAEDVFLVELTDETGVGQFLELKV